MKSEILIFGYKLEILKNEYFFSLQKKYNSEIENYKKKILDFEFKNKNF